MYFQISAADICYKIIPKGRSIYYFFIDVAIVTGVLQDGVPEDAEMKPRLRKRDWIVDQAVAIA